MKPYFDLKFGHQTLKGATSPSHELEQDLGLGAVNRDEICLIALKNTKQASIR